MLIEDSTLFEMLYFQMEASLYDDVDAENFAEQKKLEELKQFEYTENSEALPKDTSQLVAHNEKFFPVSLLQCFFCVLQRFFCQFCNVFT